jgi:hypothetical protein
MGFLLVANSTREAADRLVRLEQKWLQTRGDWLREGAPAVSHAGAKCFAIFNSSLAQYALLLQWPAAS